MQFSFGYPGPLGVGEVDVTSKIYSTMPEVLKYVRGLIGRNHLQQLLQSLLHESFFLYHAIFSFSSPPTFDMLRRVDELIDAYDFDFTLLVNFFGRQFSEDVRRGPLRNKLMDEIRKRREEAIDVEEEELSNDEETIIQNIPQLLSIWSHRDRIMFRESDLLLSIRERLQITLDSLNSFVEKGYFSRNEDGYYKWTGKSV